MGTEMFVLEHLIEAEIKRDIRMPVCLIKVSNNQNEYDHEEMGRLEIEQNNLVY